MNLAEKYRPRTLWRLLFIALLAWLLIRAYTTGARCPRCDVTIHEGNYVEQTDLCEECWLEVQHSIDDYHFAAPIMELREPRQNREDEI